uniref:Radiation-inducible immediate-early gene IEX-1 n=1 Tax=Pelusios castaneus TaxID=367368 RepID=A0A8C8S4H6_9SAUR
MNALYGATSMCLACEPRLPVLPAAEPPSKGTGPQYFTFDPLPPLGPAFARRAPAGGRKRPRKVLYPPVVKRYYPAKERSHAKRLLFILLTILFYQVYSADEDLALGQEQDIPDCSGESWDSRCETPLPQEPLEIPELTNTTSWQEGHPVTTDILEENPAAF